MRYRNLGRSGLKVSVIGLGTNQFGGKVEEKNVKSIVDAAIDAGINFIDTADIYRSGKSEESIGKALKGRREKMLIATKAYHPTGEEPNERGTSRYHLIQAVEASLKRLNTDYIDLYQMHRPDWDTPLEETMHTLHDLVTAGKVRYVGSSNYPAWRITRANAIAEANGWSRLVSEQPLYHMLHRRPEDELLPMAAELGVGILPYYPIAGGFLTGKYKRGKGAPEGSRGETSAYVQALMTDQNYDIIEQLEAFAQSHHQTLTELAHAWLLAHPQISSVISGATKVEHVLANARGGEWELTPEEFRAVNIILGDED